MEFLPLQCGKYFKVNHRQCSSIHCRWLTLNICHTAVEEILSRMFVICWKKNRFGRNDDWWCQILKHRNAHKNKLTEDWTLCLVSEWYYLVIHHTGNCNTDNCITLSPSCLLLRMLSCMSLSSCFCYKQTYRQTIHYTNITDETLSSMILVHS